MGRQSTGEAKTKQRIHSLFGDVNSTFIHSLRGFSYIWPAVLQRCELSYKAGPQGHIPLGAKGGTPPSGSPRTDPQGQASQTHSSSGTPVHHKGDL